MTRPTIDALSFTSVAIATMGACPVWDAAVAKYLAALTLCDADHEYGCYGKVYDEYLLAKHSPKENARSNLLNRVGKAMDEAEQAWADNFAKHQWDAATALVRTPAPTLAAAVFKNALIQEEDTHQRHNLPFNCMEVLAADFARLASPPRSSGAWAEAWANFEKAHAEVNAFQRDHWEPAHQIAESDGPAIPSQISTEMERLVDAECEADDAIVTAPAPDLAAAIWKLDYARERMADCEDLPKDWWHAIMGDLRRLQGTPTNSAWRAARDAEKAALEAARRFHAEHVKPAYDAHAAGNGSVADCHAQEAAAGLLDNAHLAAIRTLMETPAPTASDALHKLRVGIRELFFDGTAQGLDALKQIANDLARLIGEAK